ncbi:hypothetical protein BH09BAC1_BH09BAC1_18270 [soil metagenome]
MLKLLIASIPIILPFSIAPFLLDGGLTPGFISLALYSLLLWTVIIWRIRKGKEVLLPRFRILIIIAIAFILWSGISITYTIASADAVYWLVKWATVASFGAGLTVLLLSDKSLTNAMLKGIVLSAIATSVVGIFQLLPIFDKVINNPDFTYQVRGLLGHKNLYSSWLALLLPLVVLAIYRTGWLWKVLGCLAMVMVLLLILMVQSRSAWVALGVSGSIVSVIFFSGLVGSTAVREHLWKVYKRKILLSASVPILLLIVFFIVRPEMIQSIQTRVNRSIHFNGPKNQESETIQERFFLWGHTWQMIKEKPIMGHGGGSWRILFPQYGLQNNRSQQGYIHFQQPHNDWLWIWAEYGLIGLLLWGLFWGALIIMLIRAFWKLQNAENGITYLLMLFALLVFLINGIFDFPMERSTHLGLMAIVVAVSISAFPVRANHLANIKLPLTMVAVSLGCLSLLYLRMRGEALALYSYQLHATGNFVQAIASAAEAKSFIYQIDGVSGPMDYYEGNGYIALKKNPDALASYQAAYRHHPNHLMVLNNLGSSWQFVGEVDSAKHYYRKAIRISPRFEEPLLNMGAIAFNERVTDSAFYYLSSIYPDSKNPRYRPSIDAILRVEVRLLKQNYAPESNEWQRLNSLGKDTEVLFNRYFKAWEDKNKTYEALSRKELQEALLQP